MLSENIYLLASADTQYNAATIYISENTQYFCCGTFEYAINVILC